jgi:chloramphenicol 3-O-phosphotransferase
VSAPPARPPDRSGSAAWPPRKAARVHDGVRYDIVLDTTSASIEDSARTVLACVQQP